jgi:N-acetylglutamate synthase-like GNAT family acetyltransferase
MKIEDITFRAVDKNDKDWIDAFIAKHWGDNTIAVHNRRYIPSELEGFIALHQENRIGLVTYIAEQESLEIISLNSEIENIGVGARLIEFIKETAVKANCRKITLVTTNDNIHAAEFYKKRGFHLIRIDKGAVNLSRSLKPGIPFIGNNGIPIEDELLFQMDL